MKNKPPNQVEKKVSKIILEFGKPILSILPPKPSTEEFEAVMKIVLTIWNAVTIDGWHKNNAQEAAVLLAMALIPDEGKLVMKKLIRRKKTKFASETWAVGEHWLREENGLMIFGCDARENTTDQASAAKH
jgi:hypothetical protein